MLCTRGQRRAAGCLLILRSTCKSELLQVEPRGFEPPASAEQSQGPISRLFAVVQKHLQSADFSVAHFVIVRRRSRGLVYYWCKRVLACCSTGRSPVAIVPRSRWATRHHEPRRVQRPLRTPQGSVRSANAEQGGTLTTSPSVGLSRIQAVMRCRLVVNPGSVVVHSPEAHKTGGRAVRRRRQVHESGGP